MASVIYKRHMAKAAPGHENPSLPPPSLTQAGRDGERESADRRRYSHSQNSWTQLHTVCMLQGMAGCHKLGLACSC